MSNYMGPNTEVKKRLRRGDLPFSDMDKVSQAHDIRYMLAKDGGDIEYADEQFLAKAASSSDSALNKKMGIYPISLKRKVDIQFVSLQRRQATFIRWAYLIVYILQDVNGACN